MQLFALGKFINLLLICRGELSVAYAWLISSVCELGGSGSEELKKCPPPPLQSCDSWIVVKENAARKNHFWNIQSNPVEYFIQFLYIFLISKILKKKQWNLKIKKKKILPVYADTLTLLRGLNIQIILWQS